jgi:oligopeptide/dipeptide ABC transporter ATP-binding protein
VAFDKVSLGGQGLVTRKPKARSGTTCLVDSAEVDAAEAVVHANRERIVLQGDVPSPVSPPSGCRFHPRCRYSTDLCVAEEPPLIQHGPPGRTAACHYPLVDT